MVIDDNWSIKKDAHGHILVFSEDRVKVNKDSGDSESYLFKENYYYPNIKQSLIAYLNKVIAGKDSIKEVVSAIELAEDNINKLNLK